MRYACSLKNIFCLWILLGSGPLLWGSNLPFPVERVAVEEISPSRFLGGLTGPLANRFEVEVAFNDKGLCPVSTFLKVCRAYLQEQGIDEATLQRLAVYEPGNPHGWKMSLPLSAFLKRPLAWKYPMAYIGFTWHVRLFDYGNKAQWTPHKALHTSQPLTRFSHWQALLPQEFPDEVFYYVQEVEGQEVFTPFDKELFEKEGLAEQYAIPLYRGFTLYLRKVDAPTTALEEIVIKPCRGLLRIQDLLTQPHHLKIPKGHFLYIRSANYTYKHPQYRHAVIPNTSTAKVPFIYKTAPWALAISVSGQPNPYTVLVPRLNVGLMIQFIIRRCPCPAHFTISTLEGKKARLLNQENLAALYQEFPYVIRVELIAPRQFLKTTHRAPEIYDKQGKKVDPQGIQKIYDKFLEHHRPPSPQGPRPVRSSARTSPADEDVIRKPLEETTSPQGGTLKKGLGGIGLLGGLSAVGYQLSGKEAPPRKTKPAPKRPTAQQKKEG